MDELEDAVARLKAAAIEHGVGDEVGAAIAYLVLVDRRRRTLHADDLEAQRRLGVDECPGCGGGSTVRYCPIHGLHGTAPR
jgi:hypothetical protein